MMAPATSNSAPNYINPPTRPPAIQATCAVFVVLVTVSMVLRLYTRVRFVKELGVDDLFATIGTVSFSDRGRGIPILSGIANDFLCRH